MRGAWWVGRRGGYGRPGGTRSSGGGAGRRDGVWALFPVTQLHNSVSRRAGGNTAILLPFHIPFFRCPFFGGDDSDVYWQKRDRLGNPDTRGLVEGGGGRRHAKPEILARLCKTNTCQRRKRGGKGENVEVRMVGQGEATAEESGPEQARRRRGDAELRGRSGAATRSGDVGQRARNR